MNKKMKKLIKKQLTIRTPLLYCIHDTSKVCTECMKKIRGNVSEISGNVSWISGDVSWISGDVSWISGNVSEISGNVSEIREVLENQRG